MKTPLRIAIAAIAAIWLSLSFGSKAFTRNHWQASTSAQKGAAMTTHATGTLEVKVNPEEPEKKVDGATLGRMSFEYTLPAKP